MASWRNLVYAVGSEPAAHTGLQVRALSRLLGSEGRGRGAIDFGLLSLSLSCLFLGD